MEYKEASEFVQMLVQLAEYFPHSKVNIEAIAEGYFEDLSHLPLKTIEKVFVEARRSCEFFPTIRVLLTLAAPHQALGKICAYCQTSHGVHQDCNVGHSEAGPYCKDCKVKLAVPEGYRFYIDRKSPRLLNKTTTVPTEEARQHIRQILSDLESKMSMPEEGYKPKLSLDAVKKRKALLRRQAKELERQSRQREKGREMAGK